MSTHRRHNLELRDGLWRTADREMGRLRREAESRPRDPVAIERLHRVELRRGELRSSELCVLAKAAIAINRSGTWYLPTNDIWSVPDQDTGLDIQHHQSRSYPRAYLGQKIRSIEGLVVDSAGEHDRFACVYGIRRLTNVYNYDATRQGQDLVGQVSIGGKKYRARAGRQLFGRIRPGGRDYLVNVGVLRIAHTKENIFAP